MIIEKSCRQTVYGLNSEQLELLKDKTTFDNPAYKNAKKYSRYKYISIPPYLLYYNQYKAASREGGVGTVLNLPVGVNVDEILGMNIETIDNRVAVECGYPKFQLELRKDQIKAEQAYLSEVNKKYPKSIIQLPTGKGKSILAIHIASVLKQKTLILVHKDDLVIGWQKDIKLCFPNMKVGLIKAQHRYVGEQITIATIQTLNRMSPSELAHYQREFGLVIQDEVHHCGINMFNIIDIFHSRYKLGLSATPKRSDGLDFVFDMFFGGICYKHEVTDDDEDICGVRVIPIISNYQYKPFIFSGEIFNYYDYDPKELPDTIQFVEDIEYKVRPKIPYLTIDNAVVIDSKTKFIVCQKIIEHYRKGHSIIALFTQKEHINAYYKYLKHYIPADQILLYYGDSKEKTSVMMKKAEDKECLVTLATYAKATEGTNVKSWEVEFLVSSLNNEKNVEQATGRIRRRKEGKLNPVIVYDVQYDKAYSLRSHFKTRLNAYNRLKYDTTAIKQEKKSIFSRGYN